MFTLTPSESHYNPIGSVHGGVYATLLDSAAACAVHHELQAGVGYTSLDLSVRFLGAISVDAGPVRCTGTVITGSARRTRRSQTDQRFGQAPPDRNQQLSDHQSVIRCGRTRLGG